MKLLTTLFLLAAAASAQTPPAATQKSTPAKQPSAPAQKSTPAKQPEAPPPPYMSEDGVYAIFKTSMGEITARLFEKETPVTVANFIALARGTKEWNDPKTNAKVRKPLFQNITFHRVIPNFMIQTGDPTGTGSHNCGFTIKDEIVPTLKFDQPGRLGMANVGSPNTGGCQFFITEVPYPSLNGGYTVFGQVVNGQEVVGQIARVPRDSGDKPRTAVNLTSVVIRRVGAAPVTTPVKKAAPAGTDVKKAVPPPPAKK